MTVGKRARRRLLTNWVAVAGLWILAVVAELTLLAEHGRLAVSATTLVALGIGLLRAHRVRASEQEKPIITVRDLRKRP